MKVSPVAGPAKVGENLVQDDGSAKAARERAIARLVGNASPAQVEPTPAAVAHSDAKANVSEGQKDVVEAESESAPSTPEVPKVEASDKAEEPISSQYAILARKEKAFRAKIQAQEAALKAKEAALAEREAKIAAKSSEYDKDYIPKSKLTEDPIQALLEQGISYDQITERLLQQQTSTVDPQTKMVIRQLQEEIKALKGETENTKKVISQAQEDNYKQAVNQIRSDISRLVKDGDSFEAIRETDSVNDVVELIEKTYKEDGVLLTNEEAAQMVEEELVERISKYAKLSKIQQKFKTPTTASPETKSAQPAPENKQQPSPKTLTNGMTNTRQLSSRERAILAFEGKLGK